MSRVFIVSSTPRKSGNSEILAEEFARGAQDAGHKVEKIELRGMDLKFCKDFFGPNESIVSKRKCL